jgi:DNA processing protein
MGTTPAPPVLDDPLKAPAAAPFLGPPFEDSLSALDGEDRVGNARALDRGLQPERLGDLPEPPDCLFLHGTLPSGPCVGIVGTRSPSSEALAYAEYLAGWLSAQGVAIISGGAKGIDAAAHRGALAATGLTWVVAPSSFDRPFPGEHRQLYDEVVARGGGYLSRFEQGVPADRPNFFERNGILAALCHALIIVEAPLRSGARNAAKWARQLDRPCFVVPSAPWNERGRGCILELQLGARALAGPEEVLEVLTGSPPGSARTSLEQPGPPRRGRRRGSTHVKEAANADLPGSRSVTSEDLGPARRELEGLEGGGLSSAILRAMAAGARYPDEIARAVGASLPQVSHELLLLTLRGEVSQGAGGQITRAPR